MRVIQCADLFCGAGGSSSGLVAACKTLGRELSLTAINHWQTAVDTHALNHPWATHLCADLASSEADPAKLIRGGKLDLLIASPECTHHSVARGGKPCSDQSRASAWHVLHWAEKLRIESILIENVQEFQQWGPLTRKGRPNKRMRGATFQAFLKALESLGFKVDFKVLNAADYGDATTRKRLFVQARRSEKITWPEPTFAGKWRSAREIIDWTLKGESIFNRKRPLAERTLARIEAGLRKFGGESFITILRGTSDAQCRMTAKSIESPISTISAGGIHAGLCQPFIVKFDDHRNDDDACARAIEEPLSTITTKAGHAVCEPFVVSYHAGKKPNRVHSLAAPLPTQDCENRFAICEPFVLQCNHGAEGSSSDSRRVQSVAEPLRTITAEKSHAIAEPYLVKFYRTGGACPVTEPLDTVTTKPRFGLVEPRQSGYRLDIRFRMLQPHELAGAMSLDLYKFKGNKADQVRQIGNAVPKRTAQALCHTILKAVA